MLEHEDYGELDSALMDDVNLWRDDHSPTLSMRDWRYLHDRSYS